MEGAIEFQVQGSHWRSCFEGVKDQERVVVECPHPFLVGGPKGERGAGEGINHLGLL